MYISSPMDPCSHLHPASPLHGVLLSVLLRTSGHPSVPPSVHSHTHLLLPPSTHAVPFMCTLPSICGFSPSSSMCQGQALCAPEVHSGCP